MRSYYAHLETLKKSSGQAITPRGIYRSSSIFPVFHNRFISSRLLFLGYWLLKRNISLLTAIVTLRSQDGHIVARQSLTISEAKAFRIELKDFLTLGSLPLENPFNGSLEIEFFSATNLVFPYPAVVVNFYGPFFSSVVHTAQRVYNDFEDMWNNSQTDVPEAGFNIYANNQNETFISLVNGPMQSQEKEINWQFLNSQGESLKHTTLLKELNPYETALLHPAKLCPTLKEFLKGQAGSCKMKFHIDWIFPRLLVTTQQKEPSALTLTHTYYDCSSTANNNDYWLPSQEEWHPATLAVPIPCPNEHFTNIYFYPIYSPTEIGIKVEIFNEKGNLLANSKHDLFIKTSESKITLLELNKMVSDLHLDHSQNLIARLIAYPQGDNRLPSRIKIGYDTGFGIHEGPMSCNICTNFQPFDPSLEQKTFSFKWVPLLADQPQSYVWIINSSSRKTYQKDATVELTFFRERDTTTLKRQCHIAPHGFLIVTPHDDKELADFLSGSIGWVTVSSNNPYILTYYFCKSATNIVGGDHGF